MAFDQSMVWKGMPTSFMGREPSANGTRKDLGRSVVEAP
jgi:hypothetical protein